MKRIVTTIGLIVVLVCCILFMISAEGEDGKERIVFNAPGDETPAPQIFRIDIDGKNLENLSNHLAGDSFPLPSPNGRFIAFNSWRGGKYGIYTMDADGKNLKFIIEGTLSFHGGSWSPDSKWIAYVKGWDDVVAVNISSGETKYLFGAFGDVVSNPSWSPDGKKVIFSSKDVKDKSDIYIADIDGKLKALANLQQLTDSPESEIYPSWSPDGKKIIFSSIDRDGGGIFVMDSDGANVKQIYKNRDARCPSWSPDGKKIAFSVTDNGIFVMNSDGRNVEQIFKRGWGPEWLGQRFFSVESEGKWITNWGKIKTSKQ